MSKIEMMEVNQHTSDEVAKVLADLGAQGVDLAAIRAAVASGGRTGGTDGVPCDESKGGYSMRKYIDTVGIRGYCSLRADNPYKNIMMGGAV